MFLLCLTLFHLARVESHATFGDAHSARHPALQSEESSRRRETASAASSENINHTVISHNQAVKYLYSSTCSLRESYRSSTRDLKKAFFYRHSQIPYDAAVRAPVLPDDDASVIAAALADKSASEAEKSCKFWSIEYYATELL